MYGCERWTIKKVEHQRIDVFKLWYWRRLLRVPWTARRSNQSILKEINPEYSLEGLMLKLKLQYFGHLMWRTDSLEKILLLGKIEGRRRRWVTEDEMVGWHHRLDGHEFEQALGDGRPGALQCMGSQSDTTEPLNQWCHSTILSSVVPFSSCLQSFLASGSFWLFTSDGQSYWSFSFSISPSNE